MTEQNDDHGLPAELRTISEDSPSAVALLDTVHAGYYRALRRRRTLAAGSAGLAVVVVVGTTALVANGRHSAPSSEVSLDPDGPDVMSGEGFVSANWMGSSPTDLGPVDSAAVASGIAKVRGYTITDSAPSSNGYDPGAVNKVITATKTSITVAGHPAELWSAPKGSSDPKYLAPAERRVVWKIDASHWIQVSAAAESDQSLIDFALSMSVRPSTFPAPVGVGLTVKGMTEIQESSTSVVSQSGGPQINLCPAGGSLPASNPNRCLMVIAEVPDEGFGNRVAIPPVGSTTTIEVAGRKIQVNLKAHVAWVDTGMVRTMVTAPAGAGLSEAELAAVAASTNLSRLPVTNEPNPVPSSMPQFITLESEPAHRDPVATLTVPPPTGAPVVSLTAYPPARDSTVPVNPTSGESTVPGTNG